MRPEKGAETMSAGRRRAPEHDGISDENVDNMVFRVEPVEKKFPLYRSKFSKQVREEVKKRKDCHKTFGLPREMLLPTPLKKGSRKVVRPDVEKTKPVFPPKTKVPTKEEWSQPKQKDHTNFLLRNMITAVRLRPPQGPSRAFDSASGRRYHACNLLMPKFCFRKGFGKIPKYLEERKKILAEEEEAWRRKEEERKKMEEGVCECTDGKSVIRAVPAEERNQLLSDLKGAWEEMTKEFKLLPTIVDSVPMIKKKRHLEQILERIEKNIDLLERHEHIYVYNDRIQECCKDSNKE